MSLRKKAGPTIGADSGFGEDSPAADDASTVFAGAAGFDAALDAPPILVDAADADDAGNGGDAFVPDGSCLLKYNSDVHFDGGATGTTGMECCYAAGGQNTRDLSARCGEASGGGCCIV